MHSPWVVGAYTAMFDVTTIVSLQEIRGGACHLGSAFPRSPGGRRDAGGGKQPQGDLLTPTLPPVGFCLISVREAGPSCPPPAPRGGPHGFRGLRRSGQNQPWPAPACRGSLAAPSGSWAVGLPVPPSPGTVRGPRLRSLPGSRRPGARPVHGRWSRVPAHPCSRSDASANGAAG